VDTRRVFACGLSQGACFAWYLACFRPDLLAGTVGVAGYAPDEPHEPCLMNVLNLPMYVVHGLKDDVTPVEVSRRPIGVLKDYGYSNFVYRELSDAGHEWPRREIPGILAWLSRQRRAAFPVKVRYTNAYWRKDPPGRIYWVELREASYVPTIEAELRGNEIAVTTNRYVRRYAVRLHDEMVDLAREVVVTCNGKESYRGIPARSARRAVATFLERWDPEAIYPAELELAVP
jgi:pimeloyl-ACP methyl ester carboxylesterase